MFGAAKRWGMYRERKISRTKQCYNGSKNRLGPCVPCANRALAFVSSNIVELGAMHDGSLDWMEHAKSLKMRTTGESKSVCF